jgi:hypothetical protein
MHRARKLKNICHTVYLKFLASISWWVYDHFLNICPRNFTILFRTPFITCCIYCLCSFTPGKEQERECWGQRGMYGLWWKKQNEARANCNNERLHNLHSSQNTKVTKFRTVSWERHVARMREVLNAHRILTF